MSQTDFPKDENLRLILSKDHYEWLEREISQTRRTIQYYVVLIIVCSAWLVGVVYFVVENRDTANCVTVPADTTLQQMIKDGTVPPGIIECSKSTPEVIQSDQQQGEPPFLSSAWGIVISIVSLIAILMVMASVVDIIRNMIKLNEFKTYAEDHTLFLDKYNRR